MGSSASLDRPELAVEPGQEVTAQLRVRNNGSVVDQFTFEGLGTGAAWIDAEPDVLSLFPGAEGTVTIHFRPPRSPNTPPGPTPFGIKVVSGEDPIGSAVEEGVITVGRFADRTVETLPADRTRSAQRTVPDGCRQSRQRSHRCPVLRLRSREHLQLPVRHSRRVIEPGTARFTKLEVIPHQRFWKGPPRTHQFQVLVSEIASGKPNFRPHRWPPPPPVHHRRRRRSVRRSSRRSAVPETVNGTLLQEAMLPPWLIKAMIAAIAMLLILWILWITLFKPTVESAAKDAVEAPLASLNDKVDALPPATPRRRAVPAPVGGATTTTTIAAGGDGTPTATTTTVVDVDTLPRRPQSRRPRSRTPFGNPADFQLGFGSRWPGGQSGLHQPVLVDVCGDRHGVAEPERRHRLGPDQTRRQRPHAVGLENFRDLDLHFVAPYMFNPGSNLVMTIACTTPGPTLPGCAVSGSFGGFQK